MRSFAIKRYEACGAHDTRMTYDATCLTTQTAQAAPSAWGRPRAPITFGG